MKCGAELNARLQVVSTSVVPLDSMNSSWFGLLLGICEVFLVLDDCRRHVVPNHQYPTKEQKAPRRPTLSADTVQCKSTFIIACTIRFFARSKRNVNVLVSIELSSLRHTHRSLRARLLHPKPRYNFTTTSTRLLTCVTSGPGSAAINRSGVQRHRLTFGANRTLKAYPLSPAPRLCRQFRYVRFPVATHHKTRLRSSLKRKVKIRGPSIPAVAKPLASASFRSLQ